MKMKFLYNKRFILFVIFILIIIGIQFIGIGNYFTLATLKIHRDYLQQLVQNDYITAVALYIGFYTVVVALFVPIAAILTVAGGFLFGTFLGAVYSNIGATAAAAISFLLVRYLFGEALQKKYKERFERFNQDVERNGANYLLMIHFVAVIPFFIVNILAGLTNIRLRTFIWTTSVGIFPGALVYAFAGQQLGTISKISDIFSLPIILAFILLGILALIPIIVPRIMSLNSK